MKRLVCAAVLALAAAGAARAEIPYLSHGAGVYVDENGRPTAAGSLPPAPALPGLHPLPRLRPVDAPAPQLPPSTPVAPADPAPLPVPGPPPPPAPEVAPPDPIFSVDPVLGGYEREDLSRVAGVQVVCLTDSAWPASQPAATGLWDGRRIVMRTWRCEGIVASKAGTEPFARGLFVLAHESVHAGGQGDECEADKGGIQRMPSYAAALGLGEDAGAAARDLLLSIYRVAPLPPPYCLGRF